MLAFAGKLAWGAPANDDEDAMELPLAYTINEACAAVRIDRTSIYEAIRTEELRAVKRGRRTLILKDDLVRWLKSLPAIKRAA